MPKNKKKDYTIIWISLLVVFMILIFYMGEQGFFKSIINLPPSYPPATPEERDKLEKPPTLTETCTLAITPLAIFRGDSVTGIIQDGANTLCRVFATDGLEWRLIYTGMTDNTGRLSSTQNIELVGTFRFRAICGSCVTNEVQLIVNALPEDSEVDIETYCSRLGYEWSIDKVTAYECSNEADRTCDLYDKNYDYLYNYEEQWCCYNCIDFSASCTDSDGKNKLTPGWVTSSGYFYDDCAGNWAVKEYYCEGNIVKEEVMACEPGYICYETRGGDYCKLIESEPPAPTDSDGDGYSDADEISEGTNPNDANSYPGGGPAEQCANQCKDINYAGSYYYPDWNSNACMGYAYETCFPIHGLQYEASTYSSPCCCFDCVGW